MKMKYIGYGILGIVGFVVLMFGLQYLGVINYRFFEPKREQARREVFKQTQSYTDAKLQELSKYQYEYTKADADGKLAIKAVVRHSVAGYDETQLPLDLLYFVQECKK